MIKKAIMAIITNVDNKKTIIIKCCKALESTIDYIL